MTTDDAETGLTFEDWLRDLRVVAKGRGYGPDIVADTGEDCWFNYYEEGLVPSDAIDEDERQA